MSHCTRQPACQRCHDYGFIQVYRTVVYRDFCDCKAGKKRREKRREDMLGIGVDVDKGYEQDQYAPYAGTSKYPARRTVIKTGSIEVICGPMYSGKSEELIRRLTRAQIANRPFQLFKAVSYSRPYKALPNNSDSIKVHFILSAGTFITFRVNSPNINEVLSCFSMLLLITVLSVG